MRSWGVGARATTRTNVLPTEPLEGPMARVWMAGGAANAHSYREKQPRGLGLAKGPGSSGTIERSRWFIHSRVRPHTLMLIIERSRVLWLWFGNHKTRCLYHVRICNPGPSLLNPEVAMLQIAGGALLPFQVVIMQEGMQGRRDALQHRLHGVEPSEFIV